MPQPRFPDEFHRRMNRGPIATLASLALLAAVVLVPPSSDAASALPPGTAPCYTNAVPAGYGTFELHKTATFTQAPGGSPTASNALARIELRSPSAYAISNALVSGPGGFKATLVPEAAGVSAWSESGTEAGLAARLPAGAYTTQFQLVFPEGDAFVGFFPFTLISNLPPVPEVLNLAAAQSIPATAGFSLTWTPWIGSGTNDRIQLQIVSAAGQTVFAAASDCAANLALAPGAGSIEIPAGTLLPDTAYTGLLTYGASLLAAQDDSTLMVERGYQSRTTRFPLRTASAGGGGQPGDLLNPVVSGTNLVFTLKGNPGATYALESSVDLLTWTREQTVTLPASGTAEITVPIAPGSAPRFYQAISVGGGTTPPSPATLAVAFAAPDQLRLTVTGTAGATYSLERSATLAAWTKVQDVVIPAGSTSVTVSITIPADTAFLGFRAVGVSGSTEPPVRPTPSLSLGAPVASGNATLVLLRLTGGAATTTYSLQRSTNLLQWTLAPETVTTDGQGAGQTNLTVTGDAGIFFRSFVP